jgi:hypothetical protein
MDSIPTQFWYALAVSGAISYYYFGSPNGYGENGFGLPIQPEVLIGGLALAGYMYAGWWGVAAAAALPVIGILALGFFMGGFGGG